MTMTTVREDVTVDFPSISLSGRLVLNPGAGALSLDTDEGPERLSTNLQAWGYLPELGNAFIKDCSEHSGVTASLVRSGVVEVVREVTFGNFGSTAYEVRPILENA